MSPTGVCAFCNIFIVILVLSTYSHAFPDQGKWDKELNKDNTRTSVPKSLFNGSVIYVQLQINCDSHLDATVNVQVQVMQLKCWEDSLNFGEEPLDRSNFIWPNQNRTQVVFDLPENRPYPCSPHSIISLVKKTTGGKSQSNDGLIKPKDDRESGESVENENTKSKRDIATPKISTSLEPIYTVQADGVYLFQMEIRSSSPFNASVRIEMNWHGKYLSAADWPLLPFYGAMCLVYVMLGMAWLLVSFCNWRDLLRIQFWIGGVILLGMLEKATFYAEYQSINSTGESMKGAVLLAELVSCAKRMLARMLVIIVSLGFGIVKPRLGPMLHRVVGTGTLYFILASIESYLRVMHRKNDPSNQIFVASIPLAVLDSAICWWIFTSLVQTTRTLRLRRNLVKLSLYRHFTNTLIFAVISSVIFMLYSIKYHRLAQCLTDWKELWVDEAYWHLLFSVLLLVIMILWRPTNNNQRYAFTPLLDAPEDDDDEEDEQFVNHAFGVKMRGTRSNSPKPKSTNSMEDDLKWVEENIPTSMADATLPIMDSDEEIMTTKFEVSKMQ